MVTGMVGSRTKGDKCAGGESCLKASDKVLREEDETLLFDGAAGAVQLR